MYTLYWEKLSGAIVAQAMLEETGARYRLSHVDMAAMAHRDPAYSALCPSQRVPALTLPDGSTIGESAAIVLTLGECHPDCGLVPLPGDPDRPAFLYRLMFMATIGYPTFSRAWHPEQFTDDEAANDTVRRIGLADVGNFFGMVETMITGNPHFLPRGFGAIDLYLAMLTEWAADRNALFAENPKIGRLYDAVAGRPAYRTVIESHRAAA